MKSQNIFSKQNVLVLGIILVFLAFLSFLIIIISRSRKNDYIPKRNNPIVVEDLDIDGVSDDENLFESLDFQRVHTEFQASYLDLVHNIIESKETSKGSNDGTISIDIQRDGILFENYRKAQNNYAKVLKKVEDHEKDYKLKCFARMRKLILAVLYADKKLKKRVTKFDGEKLVEIGALDEIPVCPRGGEYSIIYKNGRRLFNCSIHGILKN